MLTHTAQSQNGFSPSRSPGMVNFHPSNENAIHGASPPALLSNRAQAQPPVAQRHSHAYNTAQNPLTSPYAPQSQRPPQSAPPQQSGQHHFHMQQRSGSFSSPVQPNIIVGAPKQSVNSRPAPPPLPKQQQQPSPSPSPQQQQQQLFPPPPPKQQQQQSPPPPPPKQQQQQPQQQSPPPSQQQQPCSPPNSLPPKRSLSPPTQAHLLAPTQTTPPPSKQSPLSSPKSTPSVAPPLISGSSPAPLTQSCSAPHVAKRQQLHHSSSSFAQPMCPPLISPAAAPAAPPLQPSVSRPTQPRPGAGKGQNSKKICGTLRRSKNYQGYPLTPLSATPASPKMFPQDDIPPPKDPSSSLVIPPPPDIPPPSVNDILQPPTLSPAQPLLPPLQPPEQEDGRRVIITLPDVTKTEQLMVEKVKCGKVLSGLAPQPADSYFTITESSLPRRGVSGMPPPGTESYIGSILNQFNTPHCEVKKHCLGDYITDPVIRQTCPLGAAGNPIVTPSQLRPSWSAAQKPVTLKLSVIKANISESGEPIFLDIVLYDIKKKRRISESFYAECNSQSSMQCSGLSELDMFSASKARIKDGIFMLPEIGETNYQDFRFFIRGYRVFIGDNDKDSSHYKKDSLSNDDHDQFFKLIKQQCSRYQSDPVPLQPYFFDTFPAYTARDQINSKVNLKGSYFAKSSITDEFALELITDSRKEKTKGLKTLPTTITIVLDKAKPAGVVLDPSMNLISSSSLPLRPGEDVAKEVACFDSTIVQEPRCVAYNDLFVYPTSLSLKDKAGNYSVIFEVININTPHYDNVSSGYLPAFGYRCPDISNGKESKNYALGCKVATSVQYKDDNPRFGEELKFRIPADFKNYCLVMSVQNVTVDSEKKQPNFFAALNLADDERFTCEKSYSLKLFESRDEAIKSAGSGRQEKKKRSITIQVHLESNIIPSNYSLGSLFLSWDEVSATVDYSKLNRIFDSTDSAVVFADVIKFFPFIMHLYQKSFVQVGKGFSALENLFRLLKTVPSIMQDSLTASQFSAALVRYLDTFNPQTYCDSAGNGVHVVVAALWAGSLGVNHAEASSQSFHCQYNWFVLRLILKSALFYAQRKGVLSEDFNRAQRFPPEFSRNVCAIISFCLMSAPESGCSSKDYEMFFETVNDCMEIIDRGLIADVLYRFIKSCTSPEKITNAELHTKVVQPLLSSFIQNPAFFQQNFPVAKPEEFFQGDFIEVCVANYMKAFPFVGVLLYYIERTFTTSTYQPIALRILKSLLRVSYFDSRFQDPSVRRSIVSMFLPFITMAVFNETARDELDPNKSMPNFLACFVYIVENLSEELLLRWWDHIIPCARIAFIKTLNTYCDQIDNTVDDDKTRQDSAELCVPSRVFELLRSIIEHRLQDIKSCPDLFKEIMQLVLKIYGQAELDHLHALIFPVINLILERLRTEFFSDGDVFQKLVKQLLCLMNAGEEASRVSAINVFISIIKRPDDGQAQADNVNTAIISACIALFKEILVETKDLRTSLKIVVDEINSSPDMFFPGASETMQKVSNLISYYEHIASAKSVDTFIQLSYNFLKQFVTSVSMLTTMLDSILSKLMSAQFFEEAAECQLHLAYAYSCLLRPSECSIKPKIDLTGLVPNLKLKEFDPDSLTGQKNCTYKLSDIIKCIDDAKCKFLTAKMYESAMRASLLASQLYLESENYFLLHISAESSCVTANDLKIQASSLRIFPKYYRVCYEAGDAYTTNFPEICGKGYIYKMDPESNLGTFKAYIKNFLLEIVPDERLLNFVTNNEKIKRPAEPDKINYQVASVEPYFTDEELATERKTIFSQNFNIRKFILSQALGTAEKAIVNNIAEQKKKKTIFTTEHAFPFIMRRIEIIKQEEFILSPIENAIEQINERSAALQKQLHSDPPKINQLQQVLQGIVLPMVNEGPMKICEVFLGNKTPNDESQKSLSDSIRVLFDLCGTALQKDAEFSGDSKLHKTLQTSYETCCEKLKQYLL